MTDTRIHPSELDDRSEPAWAGALWVGPDPSAQGAGPGGPATMLRREFVVDRAVSRARVRVYGLGLYELRLDGAKVGNLQLAPINGDYATRSVYDELDVQGPIEEGTHVLGLWLGDGYGASFNRFGFRWLGPRQAIVHLELFGPDGSVRHLVSDLDWRWSTGAIVRSDLYDGEHYDATREQVGWDRAGFDASNWRPVVALPPASPSLVSDECPRIRIVQTIPTRTVSQPAPGVHVFDLGQNISGWPRLRVSGPRGTTVRMRMAEELDQEGFLDTLTNRDAVACNTYTLAGNGEEVYEPRFTYHGFRYIEVTGLPAAPAAASITGRVVHADLVERGTFSCSDELLNQIWENHRWSIRTNSMGMPTDTPVRDERTPPAMDVQAYADAAVLNFEMADYYLKYLEDLPPGRPLPNDEHHAQQPDMAGGQVCLPWTLYHYYGDDRALRRHFPAMARFVDQNAALRPDHVWSDDAGFGDWCPPDPRAVASAGIDSPAEGRDNGSERALVNTALAFRQATTVAEAAAVLGVDRGGQPLRHARGGHRRGLPPLLRPLRRAWLRQRTPDHEHPAAGLRLGP